MKNLNNLWTQALEINRKLSLDTNDEDERLTLIKKHFTETLNLMQTRVEVIDCYLDAEQQNSILPKLMVQDVEIYLEMLKIHYQVYTFVTEAIQE